MILILSVDGDISTCCVMKYLAEENVEYIRINYDDLRKKRLKIDLSADNHQISIDGKTIPISEINCVWYRKFSQINEFHSDKLLNNKRVLKLNLKILLYEEMQRVAQSLCIALKNKFWLTDYHCINANKIEIMQIASECGFNIPESQIINSKKDIEAGFVSKSIRDAKPLFWGKRKKFGMMYTTEIQDADIKRLPDYFRPSLTQRQIDKNFELRVFYLCGEMYAMAILSQLDRQTQVDFRVYNEEKPNRYLPYNLHKKDKQRIIKFMNCIKLNCGSIDLIKAKDGSLVFLEVNPTGQFGMTSTPCNYGLHRKIANKLIEFDKKNETI